MAPMNMETRVRVSGRIQPTCILTVSRLYSDWILNDFCWYPVVSCSQSCILAFEGGYTHISVLVVHVCCCILTCIPMYS